jgi:hypothetical protein
MNSNKKLRHSIVFLCLSLLFMINLAHAQVGIGTTTPDASSVLHLETAGTDKKGVILPRMTTAERDAIASPAEGLLIYNTETAAFQYFTQGNWVELGTAESNCNFTILPNVIDINMEKGAQETITVTMLTQSGTPGNLTTSFFSATPGFNIVIDNITNNGQPTPVTKDITFTLDVSSTAITGDTGQVIFQTESECGVVGSIVLNITITGCDFNLSPDDDFLSVTPPTSGTSTVTVTTNISQAGTNPGNVTLSSAQFGSFTGITEVIGNSPCAYDCVQTLQLTVDNTVSEGTYTYNLDFTSDCGQVKTVSVTLQVNSTPRDCKQIIDENPSATSGIYTIDVDGVGGLSPFDCYCDMTTDGGGWTLVLNYLHLGGTDPITVARTTNLPLLSGNGLGTDESNLDGGIYWGHAANSLMALFDIDEVRFYGESSSHARILHFRTNEPNMIAHFQTGTGGTNISDLQAGFTPIAGHNANLPFLANGRAVNQGNNAMLNRPFRKSNDPVYDWRINSGNDWEMDDNPNDQSNDTWHQVWIR